MYDEQIFLVLALCFAVVLAIFVNLFFTSVCVDIEMHGGGPLSGFALQGFDFNAIFTLQLDIPLPWRERKNYFCLAPEE